jgi:hypothetical protein
MKVGVCLGEVENRDEWSLRQGWPTLNSWGKGKGEEKGYINNMIIKCRAQYNIILAVVLSTGLT